MAKKLRSERDAKEKKMSLRMKRFVDGVIQQVEEAGIDDEYAVAEAD